MICLSRTYPFKIFEGCLPQNLLSPPLNTVSQMVLDNIESQLITVPTVDILPKDCTINIQSLQKITLTETGNLASY